MSDVKVTYKKRKTLHLPKKKKRSWKAAKSSLTNSGWVKRSDPIDWDLRAELDTLRARSRNEAQNNDHVRHFLRLVKNNVVGPHGIRLQGKVKKRSGDQDDRTNRILETAWKAWGKHGVPDVTGMKTWKSIQREAAETVARDGEAVYRKLRGWNNGFGFALQELDVSLLDVTHNEDLGTRVIVMGVELDEWRRPVAYHFLQDSRQIYYTARFRQRIRVPAEDIYHLFLPEWTLQTRGVPWVASALERLHQVRGYEDAEVTAARVGATLQ